jgi:hypothetical protein
VNFSTGAGPEGGTFGAPVHAVFHIDSYTDGSGEPPPPALSDTFDKSVESYAVSTSVTDAGTPPVLTWDGTVGQPTPGSLKLTADYTNYNQTVNATVNISPLINLMGKTIHAQVMLDKTDAGSTFTSGYVQLHASSTGFIFSNGAAFSLTPGVWTDVTEVLATPAFASANFDPTQIIQVGVQIATGSGPEGGAFPGSEHLTFHIDSIVAQ